MLSNCPFTTTVMKAHLASFSPATDGQLHLDAAGRHALPARRGLGHVPGVVRGHGGYQRDGLAGQEEYREKNER